MSDEAKDAARYRWLRAQQWHVASVFVVAGSKSRVRLGTDCPSLERLDAIVDTAIAAVDTSEFEPVRILRIDWLNPAPEHVGERVLWSDGTARGWPEDDDSETLVVLRRVVSTAAKEIKS